MLNYVLLLLLLRIQLKVAILQKFLFVCAFCITFIIQRNQANLLHIASAAKNASTDMIQLLIDHGVDVNRKNHVS